MQLAARQWGRAASPLSVLIPSALSREVITMKNGTRAMRKALRAARAVAKQQQARQRKAAKCAGLECAPVPLVLRRLTTGDNLAKQQQFNEFTRRVREVRKAREVLDT